MIVKTRITNGILVIALTICLFLGILYFILSAGHSNSICFDIENQSIIRCKGTISKLYIISKDKKDYLHFLILPGKKGKSSFSIKELDRDYSVNVINALIDLQKFKLRPEMEYEIINHSNGDRPHGKVIIKTDKNSSVIYADKTSCK